MRLRITILSAGFIAGLLLISAVPVSAAEWCPPGPNTSFLGSIFHGLASSAEKIAKSFGFNVAWATVASGTCGQVDYSCSGAVVNATIAWPAAPASISTYDNSGIAFSMTFAGYSLTVNGANYDTSASSYSFTSLPQNTQYNWSVDARYCNQYGCIAASNNEFFRMSPMPSGSFNTGSCIPPQPANPSGSCQPAGNQATVSWSPVAGATVYALRVDNLNGGWSGTCPASTGPGDFCRDLGATSYLFTTTPGVSYNWWVHACNAAGCSPAVGGAFVCNPAPIGYLDSANCDQIAGWACDASNYNASIDVHIYRDGPAGSGTFVGAVNANVSRPDVAAAGVCGGTGNHGYSYATPISLRDSNTHTIYAYAIDYPAANNNPLLTGSPKTIRCCAETCASAGSCSKYCGPGTEPLICTRADCSTYASSRSCYIKDCCGTWGGWGTCSQYCGTGTQTRTRSCINPDTGATYTETGTPQFCNTQACCGAWSDWGACSVRCGIGGGTQTHTRTCINPSTGAAYTETGSQSCNNRACLVPFVRFYATNIDLASPRTVESPASLRIAEGQRVDFGWTQENIDPDSCVTSCTPTCPSGWPGSGRPAQDTSEDAYVYPIDANATFSIACSGEGGTVQKSIRIDVTSPVLSLAGGSANCSAVNMSWYWNDSFFDNQYSYSVTRSESENEANGPNPPERASNLPASFTWSGALQKWIMSYQDKDNFPSAKPYYYKIVAHKLPQSSVVKDPVVSGIYQISPCAANPTWIEIKPPQP